MSKKEQGVVEKALSIAGKIALAGLLIWFGGSLIGKTISGVGTKIV